MILVKFVLSLLVSGFLSVLIFQAVYGVGILFGVLCALFTFFIVFAWSDSELTSLFNNLADEYDN